MLLLPPPRRFGKAEPRPRRRSADCDALAFRDTLLRSAYGLMPLQPPQPRVVDMRRVFVGNIGWWVDDQLLAEYFGQYGTITDMQVGLGGWVRLLVAPQPCPACGMHV